MLWTEFGAGGAEIGVIYLAMRGWGLGRSRRRRGSSRPWGYVAVSLDAAREFTGRFEELGRTNADRIDSTAVNSALEAATHSGPPHRKLASPLPSARTAPTRSRTTIESSTPQSTMATLRWSTSPSIPESLSPLEEESSCSPSLRTDRLPLERESLRRGKSFMRIWSRGCVRASSLVSSARLLPCRV